MFGRRKRGIPKICIRAWLRMVGVFSRPLFSPPWIGREAPCMYPVLSPPSPQNGKGEWASDGALGSPSPPSPVRLFGEGPPPDGFPFSIATAGESQGGLWKTFVRQGPFPIFFLKGGPPSLSSSSFCTFPVRLGFMDLLPPFRSFVQKVDFYLGLLRQRTC